jgi:hypothetical protein
MYYLIAVVVALVVGFGLGRIKNAAKLAAIEIELNKIGVYASDEVKKLVGAIKTKL